MYMTTHKLLVEVLMAIGFTNLDKVKSLLLFSHELEDTMPEMNHKVRKQLLLQHIVAGLPLHISKQLWAVEKPHS